MDLAEEVYKVVALFPKEEKYGLVSQLRRCAVSVPSNISEGAGRATKKQFQHFLEFSMGSCNELQTQLELSKRFGYLEEADASRVTDEVNQLYRMILSFYNTLNEH